MKKLALVLMSDYSKSWIDSGNLFDLSKQSDLTVYASDAVLSKIEKVGFELKLELLPNFKASRTTNILQLVSLINRRKLSSSFDFRLKRLIFGDLKILPKILSKKTSIFHAVFYNLKRMTRFVGAHPIETLAFVAPLGKFLELSLAARFKKLSNQKFAKINFDRSFDMVLLPSAAIEDRIFEFVEFLRQSQITTAICIENWDNLTSKSILISRPDYVFVMGQFCIEHGEKIQSLDPTHIIAAGLPRFNSYRNNYSGSLNIRVKEKFKILYLGFSVPHNERNLLNKLISLMDNAPIAGQYEFFYKPHPVRQPRFYEDTSTPRNVKIIEHKSDLTGLGAIPAIDASHIQNIMAADLVISTPTSMAIESMLLGIPTVIDSSDDGVHRTTAKFSLESYLHLRDLKKIEGVIFAESAEEMFEEIMRHFLGESATKNLTLDKLIESKNVSYVSNIMDLANRL